MKTISKVLIILTVSVLGFNRIPSFAQCTAPPAAGTCSGGNGVATNGVNINSGQTFWFSGTGTFGSGVNLNGGTLRVCGNLILSSITFNSGTILIETGGTLTINTGGTLFFNGNCTVSNRGTLNINCGITMQNANNILLNAINTSVLNMNSGSYTLEINSATSKFVNYGLANIRTLFIQGSGSAGCICLGFNSSLNLTNLNNNMLNSFSAPSGSACVRYTGNAALNANLTTTSNVRICRAGGSTTSGGAGFGSALINTNCLTCSIVLPITLLYFKGELVNNIVILEWATALEAATDYFIIEKSKDAVQWHTLASTPASGASDQILKYTRYDNTPEKGTQYYRLKQRDINGKYSYSSVIAIEYEPALNTISIYPNPNNTNTLHISGISNNERYSLVLKDITGKKLYEPSPNSGSLILPRLNPGIYIVTIHKNDRIYSIKYIVE